MTQKSGHPRRRAGGGGGQTDDSITTTTAKTRTFLLLPPLDSALTSLLYSMYTSQSSLVSLRRRPLAAANS